MSEIRTRHKCKPGARKWRFFIKREGNIGINQCTRYGIELTELYLNKKE